MADSFIRVPSGTARRNGPCPTTRSAGLVGLASKGQSWPPSGGWIEVEGGGAVRSASSLPTDRTIELLSAVGAGSRPCTVALSHGPGYSSMPNYAATD